MSGTASKPTRHQRMIQLKVMGYTAEQIRDKLTEEGYRKCSLVTVNRYLAKTKFADPAPAFKEELMRRQLMDISLIEEPEARCKVRQPIIDKFYSTKISQQIEETVKHDDSDLRTLTEEERQEIRKAGRILLNKRPGAAGSANIQ